MQALGGEHDYYIIILYQYHPSRSLDRFQALSLTHVLWAALRAQATEGVERL